MVLPNRQTGYSSSVILLLYQLWIGQQEFIGTTSMTWRSQGITNSRLGKSQMEVVCRCRCRRRYHVLVIWAEDVEVTSYVCCATPSYRDFQFIWDVAPTLARCCATAFNDGSALSQHCNIIPSGSTDVRFTDHSGAIKMQWKRLSCQTAN